MTDELVAESVDVLRGGRVPLERGLSEAELDAAQQLLGVAFSSVHHGLLRAVLPVGDDWTPWRHGSEAELRRLLDWPVEGLVPSAVAGRLWFPAWGLRPARRRDVAAVVRARVAGWPPLVPLQSTVYLPGGASPAGTSLLSVHETDVIYAGADLPAYLRRAVWHAGLDDDVDPPRWPGDAADRRRHRPVPGWDDVVHSRYLRSQPGVPRPTW